MYNISLKKKNNYIKLIKKANFLSDNFLAQILRVLVYAWCIMYILFHTHKLQLKNTLNRLKKYNGKCQINIYINSMLENNNTRHYKLFGLKSLHYLLNIYMYICYKYICYFYFYCILYTMQICSLLQVILYILFICYRQISK